MMMERKLPFYKILISTTFPANMMKIMGMLSFK